MVSVATETCENCGRGIGRLEAPHLHDGHVVCADCAKRLAGDDSEPVVIEATGKSWKAWQLGGGMLMAIGLSAALFGGYTARGTGVVTPEILIGLGVAVIGLLLLVAASIGAWWYHG